MGREAFLLEYGYGAARAYWLLHNGKPYDSKAILGVAHKYARPDLGALGAHDFVGGDNTVRRKLIELGFDVEVTTDVDAQGARTSDSLSPGEVYTRKDLKEQFDITDATINTGVFQPKGTPSIWLFVTEDKTADRTQYKDRLEGDMLYWQGQLAGRKDALIINHKTRGLELLVFFRKNKGEFAGAGFCYLGSFDYVEHSGSAPASFVLRRQSPGPLIDARTADEGEFDPANIDDARKKVMRAIAVRRGQRAFREALLQAYDYRCAITNCSIIDLLEAAHIHPYRGEDTNRVDNGLLLRTDIHTLFDCGLLAIDPESMCVVVADPLKSTEYGDLDGTALRRPQSPETAPSKKALQSHREEAKL